MTVKSITLQIKLESFDIKKLHKAALAISNAALQSGAQINGPIPLTKKVKRVTVIRSPHVNKKSMDSFWNCVYRRLLCITNSNQKTIELLSAVELSGSVGIKIKAT